MVTQRRTGILRLAPEVGRFKHLQEDNKLCELSEAEKESHFLLYWSHYDDETSFQHPEMSRDEEQGNSCESATFFFLVWKIHQDGLFVSC